MGSFLERLVFLASAQAGNTAIRVADRRITFGELPHLVMDTAAQLAFRGIAPGRVVAVSLSDDTEHMIVALALLALGAWQVSAATHDSAATRAELVHRTRADAQILESLQVAVPGVEHILWDGRAPQAPVAAVVPTGCGGAYFSTSGTTGRLSIVRLDEAMLMDQARRDDYRPDDSIFKSASMEFGHVKRNRLFAVWAGAENLLRHSDETGPLSAWLATSRATIADISRVNLTGIMSDGAAGLPQALMLRAEGSALPAQLRQAVMARVTPNFHIRYAATETGLIAIAGPEDHHIDGSVGRPKPEVEVAITEADGTPVAPGEIGEIRLRTPGMASGYFDDPAKTALRFQDGWFLPGDLGRLMSDGLLVMVGRKDDVINLSGIKIFPIEIENALASHPDVRGVAVFPVPSSVHGQIPVAVVELHPDALARKEAILTALTQSARAALGIRAPRKVLACASLPRNAMGKVVTRDLLYLFERPT